jgi:hypothetical protein
VEYDVLPEYELDLDVDGLEYVCVLTEDPLE